MGAGTAANAARGGVSVAAQAAGKTSVWSLGPATRGRIIEEMLGARLGNFPTIDKFVKGVATSIKSLDVHAKTYQNVAALTRTVTGYIDKVAKFSGATWNNISITAGQVTGRALELAIPAGATAEQMTALNALVQYGKSVGVEVVIRVIP